MPSRHAIIEAPSILGLKPSGVELLSETLLGYGLAERIKARHAGRIEPLPFDPAIDPATGVLNADAMAEWSPKLADAVEAVLDRGEFPVILGGDCSIILGPALALRRRGRYGLLYIDAHADFYQPEAEPSGEAASMDLAFVTGYGPALLTNLERRGPLIRSTDAVVFGFRDGEEQRRDGSQPLPADLLAFNLAKVREMGIEAAATNAVDHLTRSDLDGFFIHFDADCLDDAVMPAVDYRLPEGLSLEEAAEVLRTALRGGKASGIEVTIYNPRLDADGSAGRALTDLLVHTLREDVP